MGVVYILIKERTIPIENGTTQQHNTTNGASTKEKKKLR